MTKGEKAKEIFEQGYNCAQATLMAYSEDYGMDQQTAARVACTMGGGIARSRETCGAVIGCLLVIGLKYSGGSPEDKTICYKKGAEFMKEFERENGSCICKVLLGLEKKETSTVPEKRTSEYYKKRPCSEIVRFAADCLENFLND